MENYTLVSLSHEEITTLRWALKQEIERLDELIKIAKTINDPANPWKRDRAAAQALYKKLDRASLRAYSQITESKV